MSVDLQKYSQIGSVECKKPTPGFCFLSSNIDGFSSTPFREKKAHKHKLFALVNVQMALGQTAGCPRVNRAK